VALFLTKIDHQLALWIIFLLLIWQGIGGGLTANPWQSMIGKIIPGDIRATFYGSQSAASNLLASVGASLGGLLLQNIAFPYNYSLSFFIACFLMIFSWIALSRTREPVRSIQSESLITFPFWRQVKEILRTNRPFRWFLITRMLTQFTNMSFAFYTVYAVRYLGMTATTAGILTSVLLVTQVISNPLLGRIADRWSRRYVLEFGAIAATLSSVLAWLTPSVGWFYIVIILEGIGLVAYWTIGLAMTLEFGAESERPTYIGLANTLIAPATIIAPLIGGLIADSAGYAVTFSLAAIAGLVTIFVLHFMVKDPQSAIMESGSVQTEVTEE
jgi:MFS family permease